MTATTVLVLLNRSEDGLVCDTSLELVTAARQVAGGGPLHAMWVGAEPSPDALVKLGSYGVRHLHRLVVRDADIRLPAVQAVGLVAVQRAVAATAVLTASDGDGSEVAAHLAMETGGGVIADAESVRRDDADRVIATKSVLAGTWTTQSTVLAEPAVVCLSSGSVLSAPAPEAAGPLVVDDCDVSAAAAVRGVRIVEQVPAAVSARPDLGSADIVVVGGRGVDGDFSALEELADLLGAAIGATRVATDEGWIGHEVQIGQTGVNVSPRLYLGAGVSGAVHHRGGMQAAGVIVAVNSDPEAPIFEIADYGIVGDLAEVIPALTEELRRLL